MCARLKSLRTATFAYFCAFAIVLPACAAELGTIKNSERGVTVAVTPVNLSAGASSWDFKISLDTHSADLDDDLRKSAVLLDGKGGKHAPVGWDGAAPGGHHREGILRFKPLSPRPAAIELWITRPDETRPRAFRWKLVPP
jgi:hypothetical protein